MLAILREFLTRHPRRFVVLFVALLVEGAVAALSILAIVPLTDFVLDPTLQKPSRLTALILAGLSQVHISPSFWIFGAAFTVTVLAKGVMEVAIRYAVLRIKYSVVRDLVGETLGTFFGARWSFFSNADHGRLLSTLNRDLANISDTLGHLATLLAQVVQLCIYLAIPIWLEPAMTGTAMGIAFVIGLPFLLLRDLSYRLGKESTETYSVVMGVLADVLASARIIIGFGRQASARRRYLDAFDAHSGVAQRAQVLSLAVLKLYYPLAMLAVVLATGMALGRGARMSEVAAVLWSLIAAMPILVSVLQGNVNIANFLPSYEQLVSLRGSAAANYEALGDRAFSQLACGIELQSITFAYPDRPLTLAGVSLWVARGKMTALAGESGSGKSTILDLVLGLQVPSSGTVLLDGVPLAAWNQNLFRERVGYVPQDPFLFNTSIRENLLWSNVEASEAQLWDSLRLANADSFVSGLPRGLDTVVGDRGLQLSGGQRQRIALARALVRRPELLLLDEATSALDSESERAIQKAIEVVARETTVLVVAHRLSTISSADMVYVIRRGVVAESGSFVTLASQPGSWLRGMIVAQSGQANAPENASEMIMPS